MKDYCQATSIVQAIIGENIQTDWVSKAIW